MKSFFEKYATAIWMVVFVIWAIVGFFVEKNIHTYLIAETVFWSIYAVCEFIRIKNKKVKMEM